MTYCLNKIAGWVLSPIGIALVLAAVAALPPVRGRRWLCRAAFALAFATLWLFGMPLTARFLGAPLESGYLVDGRIPDAASFPSVDVIVVLGGGMNAQSALSADGDMGPGADRVWQGARLWKAGRAPRVIATGTDVEKSSATLFADLGVSASALTFVPEARNTEEEARAVSALGVTNVLLVTSAWHMNRARLMFEKYAPQLKVVPAPSDFASSGYRTRPLRFGDFFPNAEAFEVNSASVREYVGYWGYRLLR